MPKEEKPAEAISPTAVWGKVITQLRTQKQRSLFIACGEINSVSIKDNTFIIFANENNKFIMDIPENFKILQDIIGEILPNHDIFVKEITLQERQQKMKMRLKELFGDKLIIEGE